MKYVHWSSAFSLDIRSGLFAQFQDVRKDILFTSTCKILGNTFSENNKNDLSKNKTKKKVKLFYWEGSGVGGEVCHLLITSGWVSYVVQVDTTPASTCRRSKRSGEHSTSLPVHTRPRPRPALGPSGDSGKTDKLADRLGLLDRTCRCTNPYYREGTTSQSLSAPGDQSGQ